MGIVRLGTRFGVMGARTLVSVAFFFFRDEDLCVWLCVGLPAFKPGEKVEIDFGMDDI